MCRSKLARGRSADDGASEAGRKSVPPPPHVAPPTSPSSERSFPDQRLLRCSGNGVSGSGRLAQLTPSAMAVSCAASPPLPARSKDAMTGAAQCGVPPSGGGATLHSRPAPAQEAAAAASSTSSDSLLPPLLHGTGRRQLPPHPRRPTHAPRAPAPAGSGRIWASREKPRAEMEWGGASKRTSSRGEAEGSTPACVV